MLAAATPAVTRAQPVGGLDYDGLIQLGIDAFDAERWAEAMSYFERAHALAPSARTLRAIGFTSFELGDFATSARCLGESLTDPRRPLTAEQRRVAEALLARAVRSVGRLAIVVDPPDARVQIDGVVAVAVDAHYLVNPGPHELVVDAPGFERETRDVRVDAGRTETVTISLRVIPIATPATPATPPPEDAERGRRLHRTGWSLVGASGAFGLVSLATGVRGQSIHDALRDRCTAGVCPASEAASIDRGRRLVHTSTTTTFLTLGAGVAGAVVLLVNRGSADDEPEARVRVVDGPGTAGLGMEYRF